MGHFEGAKGAKNLQRPPFLFTRHKAELFMNYLWNLFDFFQKFAKIVGHFEGAKGAKNLQRPPVLFTHHKAG